MRAIKVQLTSITAAAIFALFTNLAAAKNTTTVTASSNAGSATSNLYPPSGSKCSR
jgi:hypothetical protein